jgi:hypothetical protein
MKLLLCLLFFICLSPFSVRCATQDEEPCPSPECCYGVKGASHCYDSYTWCQLVRNLICPYQFEVQLEVKLGCDYWACILDYWEEESQPCFEIISGDGQYCINLCGLEEKMNIIQQTFEATCNQ